MLPGWIAVSVFLAYVAALFALAQYGDRAPRVLWGHRARKAIYALTSCVYFSAWSFFGSVGVASRHGIDFLPSQIGPVIVFAVFYPVIIRMVRVAKAQNITSIADFVAARYGKAGTVAATVTIIATLGYIPYIALQIKAIAQSLTIFIDGRLPSAGTGSASLVEGLVAILLAGFTLAIGARRLDATEHHRGLMLAVAVESIIKLATLLAVGIFVCWGLYDGPGDLAAKVAKNADAVHIFSETPTPSVWVSAIIVTMAATLVLPRQFHVSVVENRDDADVRTAAWAVPLYILAINVFVLPIAAAGTLAFPANMLDRDFTILALPIEAKANAITLLALVGGLSAATAMVFVAATALAVMVSNDLVIPLLLRAQARQLKDGGTVHAPPILAIRRIVIVVVLLLSWMCADALSDAKFASIGFLSLLCIVQIAPAALCGLFWRRATGRGAIGGSLAGVAVCACALALPSIIRHGGAPIMWLPLTMGAAGATSLSGVDLTLPWQAAFWSLAINTAVFVGLSLSRRPNTNERVQANIFVRTKPITLATSFRLRHYSVITSDLLTTVAHYLGPVAADRLFVAYHTTRNIPFDLTAEADGPLIQHAEHLIASAIGTASSRVVISLLLERREISRNDALQIVDDVALEIQNSRDLVQHAIDIAQDGMAVYDADLHLVAWNRAYRDMFQLPQDIMRVGVPLEVLVRSNAARGVYGEGPVEQFVKARLEALRRPTEGMRLHSAPFGRVLEMRSMRLPTGGIFFTYTDATERAKSEEDLEAENETLERRVHERTEELQRLNLELARAKAESEEANISKSRFLAAASHDILQPLSAARLYTTSLRERLRMRTAQPDMLMLAANVDASLEAVEDILGALLEISHLDAGATKTEFSTFAIEEILRQLKMEFEPLARERALGLTFMPSSLRVVSDRRLLRRLLQNLISNAVKYTFEGGVLVGARRVGSNVRIDVYDTGPGIPALKHQLIFREFERLPQAMQTAAGAGLGLSIVERLSRVLKHEIKLRSKLGKGSVFSVTVPRAEPALLATIGMPTAPPARQRSLEGLVVAAIDNERHILAGMAVLLQGWDCIVASGTGLPEVDASLAKQGLAPDVIVADYHIGELDGLAVIAALRERFGPRPAVLVTADRSTAIRDLAQAADVRVLNKPLKPAALRSLLSQWRLVKAAAE